MTRRIFPIFKLCVVAISISCFFTDSTSAQSSSIKIGIVATTEGKYESFGRESLRGAKLALKKLGGRIGEHAIEFVQKSSDGKDGSAVAAATAMIEQGDIKLIIGPMSYGEGVPFRDLAKKHPEITFINGSSAAPEATLFDPAPNFFRFNADAAQWMAGLGKHAFNKKKYKKVVTIAENSGFPKAQVRGFAHEFCSAGGQIVKSFWVPQGQMDFSEIIERLPEDFDAIFMPHGGEGAITFLSQYEAGTNLKPLIGGSVTIDKALYDTRGDRTKYITGIPAAGPVTAGYDGVDWKKFVTDYQEEFPKGYTSPSLFSHAYYVNTLAILTALEKVNGDLSDNQKLFRKTLSSLEIDTPTGKVMLDENRQAIADIFVSEVQKGERKLTKKFMYIVPAVNQVLNSDRDAYLALGPVTSELPKSCLPIGN